jgi:hypothetical protein
LNSLTASRLDNYLSRLFEGLSETANKGKIFDQHLLNEKSKDHFMSEFKPLSQLNSCLNRIVSFININSVSLKTRDKNLNAAMRAF